MPGKVLQNDVKKRERVSYATGLDCDVSDHHQQDQQIQLKFTADQSGTYNGC